VPNSFTVPLGSHEGLKVRSAPDGLLDEERIDRVLWSSRGVTGRHRIAST
jgi:hypothetical protein